MKDSKMKAIAEKNMIRVSLLVGAAMWIGLSVKFKKEDRFDFEPNIACINGSPYGKVLVLVMQGSISVYFHEGGRHEDAEFLRDTDTASDDHADCDHEGCDHESHKKKPEVPVAHEHGEDCGCEEHAAVQEGGAKPVQPRLDEKAKRLIKTLQAYTHRKTDGYVLTPAHKKYIQRVIEDKLKFAYELDPSNYENYEGYSHYLTTTGLGKSEADFEAAIALARRTLAYCKDEEVDPFVLLTGANAAHDIGYCMSVNPESYSIEDTKQSLEDYEYCLQKYQRLLLEAQQNGFTFSAEKFEKMDQLARLLMTRLRGQRVYLNRIFSETGSEQ